MPRRPRTLVALFVPALFALALVPAAAAGPLDPPAGPIAPTPGPEPRTPIGPSTTPGDADSVFRITQPGSYYLTANVIGVPGKHGIEIASSGVTVDLAGFEVSGAVGSLDGIRSGLLAVRSITVRNGSVRGWGGAGINFNAPFVVGSLIDGVLAAQNAGDGIAFGNAGVVVNCTANDNGLNGFRASFAAVFANCAASANDASGFSLGIGATCSACSAQGNGDDGFVAGAFTTIVHCTSVQNGGDGIAVNADCRVLNNLCSANTNGAGIFVSGVDNRIDGNTCSGNTRGIDVNSVGNFIARNVCSGNALNWEINSGNVCLVVNATTSGSISGNAGGTSPGSTDPNANFTY